MFANPPRGRALLVPIILCSFAMVARSEDPVAIALVTSRDSTNAINDVIMRPNTKQEVFVRLENKSPQAITKFRVSLEGLGPKSVKQVTLDKGRPQIITFDPPKVEAKKEEPKKDGDEAKGEVPPGVPLAGSGKNSTDFRFTVRVEDENGAKLLDAANAAVDNVRTFSIPFPSPKIESSTPEVKFTNEKEVAKISATIPGRSLKNDEPAKIEPPVIVNLAFPPQVGLKLSNIGTGTYRRELSDPTKPIKLDANQIPITRGKDNQYSPLRFYLNLDGLARTYVYKVTDVLAKEATLTSDTSIAVRMFPLLDTPAARTLAERLATNPDETQRLAVRPTKSLRFRVEADNAPENSTLEVRIDRTGGPTVSFANDDERISLGRSRDFKVWIDLKGPNEGILVTNTVTDHIASVDVSALRGEHDLQAVLLIPGETSPKAICKFKLIVDDSPPAIDKVQFLPLLETRHEKGTPLPLSLIASDSETKIEKVTFILGKPGPDGKFPDDAAKFSATETDGKWSALVQLPAPAPADKDKKAPAPKEPVELHITGVVENEVGLITQLIGRLELVEPKGAIIEAKVLRGGRPQLGATVVLRDGEGKDKAVATTDKKTGKATFTHVAPGIYRLSCSIADAGLGLAGSVAVTVPEPPPANNKPIDAVIEMIKRR